MALKKLPNNVQSLFCASTQINSYRKAVEELVYNSLDAKSTSIALRVHIEGGLIQVIDNGHGVTRKDLCLLGQRYMTSKFFDLYTSNSAPNYYGFHGESLANIIKISQSVKVTSRHENIDETWLKTFKNENKIELTKLTSRPSKGTTVEINGFLYNLRLKRKATDAFNELQDIKTFLEQLSLVHSNISLSLRDDSKNEIVFTIHKNRDIYQTLYTLFGVDKTDVQELQVEKHQYKVKAFIGKGNKEIGQHYVYLNGKFISYNSGLHKIINNNINKYISQTKNKSKNLKNDDDQAFFDLIPFYYIFITCPYMDYDVSNTPKQTILEFKNWDQIKNLLEKVIKFYVGDVIIKEVPIPEKKQTAEPGKVSDTRDQVKIIMDKILGNHSKKTRISQMKNGVKGKQIKRKDKKKSSNIYLSKIIPPKENNREGINITTVDNQVSNNFHLDCNISKTNSNKKGKIKITAAKKKQLSKRITKSQSNKKSKNSKFKKILMQKQLMDDKIVSTHKKKLLCGESIANRNNSKLRLINDPLITKFAMETDSVRRRCNILAQKADESMSNKNKKKRTYFINETVQFSSVIKDNKNVSVRHKYDEIVIRDYEPISPIIHTQNIDYLIWNKFKTKTSFQTTYDLVRTILKSQQEGNLNSDRIENLTSNQNLNQPSKCGFRSDHMEFNNIQYIPVEPRLTFQSHDYHKKQKLKTDTVDFNNFDEKTRNVHFITIQSRDNFVAPNDGQKYKNEQKEYFKSRKNNDICKNKLFNLNNESKINRKHKSHEYRTYRNNNRIVVSNEISPITDYEVNPKFSTELHSDDIESNHESILINGNTYTMAQNIDMNFEAFKVHCGWNKNATHNMESSNDKLSYNLGSYNDKLISRTAKLIIDDESICNKENNYKAVFVSKSQCCDSNFALETGGNLDPIHICETILSPDIFDKEFEFNFDVYDIQNEFQQNNYFDDIIGKEHDLSNHNEENPCEITEIQHMPEIVSHNFLSVPNNNKIVTEDNEERIQSPLLTLKVTNRIHANENRIESLDKGNQDLQPCPNNDKFDNHAIDLNDFNFKDRLRFLPKGMSPIFDNCHTKATCKYNLDKDFYEDSIYSNFANNVQVNSEIFEPRIQYVNDLTTRDIEKCNNKLNKDKASLKFDGQSIKNAKVLGQVDEKFIAAIMKTKCRKTDDTSQFLVLFDQHAVHERIRLEKNLSDYCTGNKWKSISLAEILLKGSKEELLYLHNYTDKFTQFGLQWNIVNDSEISLNAIPEAILGKNPRQVEKVIKSIKKLIAEEISNIKLQGGCVSLYPRSIMDLVFSEACRYAIKFGDKLSKYDCMALLNELSDCKTPFQCAHGRPVMAVIMDLKCNKRKYKINMAKLKTKSR